MNGKTILTIAGVLLAGTGVSVSIAACGAISEADRIIAEADEFLANQPEYKPHVTPIEQIRTKEVSRYAATEREYPWELEMCGKVVGFEVGLSCDQCKFYVASACVNRLHNWYGDRPIAMITDYSDETGYYMMWPEYAYEDEFYGYSFTEHYDEIMPYVWAAEKNPADIWFWDCADTQGEWSELVWHCEQDDMYYYTVAPEDRYWKRSKR